MPSQACSGSCAGLPKKRKNNAAALLCWPKEQSPGHQGHFCEGCQNNTAYLSTAAVQVVATPLQLPTKCCTATAGSSCRCTHIYICLFLLDRHVDPSKASPPSAMPMRLFQEGSKLEEKELRSSTSRRATRSLCPSTTCQQCSAGSSRHIPCLRICQITLPLRSSLAPHSPARRMRGPRRPFSRRPLDLCSRQ